MLSEALDSLIQGEIDKGIEEFKEDHKQAKIELEDYKNKYQETLNQYNELLKSKNQISKFNEFKSLINNGNIGELIQHLNLIENNIDFTGMDSKENPLWFKLLNTYYEDKEKLFMLMDMFEIKYPVWAKTYVNPQNYGEKELDLIFDYLGKMYVCNGAIFSGNMGFFWDYQRRYEGNLDKLFSRESYVEIPWNLLLQNKLLTSDKYFNKITESISNGYSHSEYFYKIHKYQELSKDQINKMASHLSTNKLWEIHKGFIKDNGFIFEGNRELALYFKGNMSSYYNSPFYYLHYPLDMQITFIKNLSDNYDSKFKMIKNMNIDLDNKLELLKEIAEKELSVQ